MVPSFEMCARGNDQQMTMKKRAPLFFRTARVDYHLNISAVSAVSVTFTPTIPCE